MGFSYNLIFTLELIITLRQNLSVQTTAVITNSLLAVVPPIWGRCLTFANQLWSQVSVPISYVYWVKFAASRGYRTRALLGSDDSVPTTRLILCVWWTVGLKFSGGLDQKTRHEPQTPLSCCCWPHRHPGTATLATTSTRWPIRRMCTHDCIMSIQVQMCAHRLFRF